MRKNLQEKAALEPITTTKTHLTIQEHSQSKEKNFKTIAISRPLKNKLPNQLVNKPPKWKNLTCLNSSRLSRTKPHLDREKSSLILLFPNTTHLTNKSVKQLAKTKTLISRCSLRIKHSVTTLLNIPKCPSCNPMNIMLLF